MQQLLDVALVQAPSVVFSGWKWIALHRNPEAGAHEMIRYTPTTTVALRSRRELDSAASGSSHSTYQGSTQLSETSSATLAQPDAVIVRSNSDPRPRQASTQQPATVSGSTPLTTVRSVSLSPPAPTARPIRSER